MSGFIDEEGLPATLREDELINGVTGRRPDLDRTLALKELLRRQYPRRIGLLGEVVADRQAPPELRSTAALALGEEAGAEGEAALIVALKTEEPLVVRRAAESLGRIGDRKALAALAEVRAQPGGATARSLAFARTLISYRLGLGTDRLQTPPADALLSVPRERGVALKFEPVKPEAARADAAALKETLPAIAIAERGSVRFSCRTEHLWIVVSEDAAGKKGLGRIAGRDAVTAVVLKQSTCPGGWYVYEYILSHPRDEKALEMFGVRPSGEMVHFGEVALKGGEAAVTLRALNTPYVPAIEFTARYGGAEAAFVMTEALVAVAPAEKQRRPATPRKDAVPAR